MLSWIAGAVLALVGQDDAAAGQETATNEATKALVGLTDQLSQAESYRFTSLNESEGGGGFGGFGGRGGRGGEGEGGGERRAPEVREPTPIQGVYKKGLPLQVTVGELLAYKEGEQIVYRDEAGEWQAMEPFQPGGFGGGGFGRGERGGAGGGGRGGEEGGVGGGRGGGEGGAGGGRGGEEGGEGGDRPRRDPGQRGGFSARRSLFSVMGVSAPHALLGELGAKVCEVEMQVAADAAAPAEGEAQPAPPARVFTGKLTEEGVQSLGGGGMFRGRGGFGGGRGGGGEGGGPQMESSGSFTIEAQGRRITSIRLEITRSGTFGERSFERTTIRTLTFEEVGEAELEVPEEALAQFEI